MKECSLNAGNRSSVFLAAMALGVIWGAPGCNLSAQSVTSGSTARTLDQSVAVGADANLAISASGTPLRANTVAVTWSNTNRIRRDPDRFLNVDNSRPDSPLDPYPSSIAVSGVNDVVARISVTLHNL